MDLDSDLDELEEDDEGGEGESGEEGGGEGGEGGGGTDETEEGGDRTLYPFKLSAWRLNRRALNYLAYIKKLNSRNLNYANLAQFYAKQIFRTLEELGKLLLEHQGELLYGIPKIFQHSKTPQANIALQDMFALLEAKRAEIDKVVDEIQQKYPDLFLADFKAMHQKPLYSTMPSAQKSSAVSETAVVTAGDGQISPLQLLPEIIDKQSLEKLIEELRGVVDDYVDDGYIVVKAFYWLVSPFYAAEHHELSYPAKWDEHIENNLFQQDGSVPEIVIAASRVAAATRERNKSLMERKNGKLKERWAKVSEKIRKRFLLDFEGFGKKLEKPENSVEQYPLDINRDLEAADMALKNLKWLIGVDTARLEELGIGANKGLALTAVPFAKVAKLHDLEKSLKEKYREGSVGRKVIEEFLSRSPLRLDISLTQKDVNSQIKLLKKVDKYLDVMANGDFTEVFFTGFRQRLGESSAARSLKLFDLDKIFIEALVDIVLIDAEKAIAIVESYAKRSFDNIKLMKPGEKERFFADARERLTRFQSCIDTLLEIVRDNPDWLAKKVPGRAASLEQHYQELQKLKDWLLFELDRKQFPELVDVRDGARITATELENMLASYEEGGVALLRGFVYYFGSWFPGTEYVSKYSKTLKQLGEARTIVKKSEEVLGRVIEKTKKTKNTVTTKKQQIWEVEKEDVPEDVKEAEKLREKMIALDKSYPEFHQKAFAAKKQEIERKIDSFAALLAKIYQGENRPSFLSPYLEIWDLRLREELLERFAHLTFGENFSSYSTLIEIEEELDTETAALKRLQENFEIATILSNEVKNEFYHAIADMPADFSVIQLSKKVSQELIKSVASDLKKGEEGIRGCLEKFKKAFAAIELEVMVTQRREEFLEGAAAELQEVSRDLRDKLAKKKNSLDAIARIIEMNNPDLQSYRLTSAETSDKARDISEDMYRELEQNYKELFAVIDKMVNGEPVFAGEQKDLGQNLEDLHNGVNRYLRTISYCVSPSVIRLWFTDEEYYKWEKEAREQNLRGQAPEKIGT